MEFQCLGAVSGNIFCLTVLRTTSGLQCHLTPSKLGKEIPSAWFVYQVHIAVKIIYRERKKRITLISVNGRDQEEKGERVQRSSLLFKAKPKLEVHLLI